MKHLSQVKHTAHSSWLRTGRGQKPYKYMTEIIKNISTHTLFSILLPEKSTKPKESIIRHFYIGDDAMAHEKEN